MDQVYQLEEINKYRRISIFTFLPSSLLFNAVMSILLLIIDDGRTCKTNFCASLSNK